MIVSLIVGALIGAAIICAQYLIGVYQVNGTEYFREYGLSNGMAILTFAFVIWLFAICLFGVPVWAILHKKKYTYWVCPLLAGFLIPFIIVFAMQTGFFTGRSGYTSYYANGGDQVIEGRLTAFGWKMAFLMALQYATIGSLIALAIWFINYKTSKDIPT